MSTAIEAESRLVALCIANPALIDQAIDRVADGHFADHNLGLLWRAMTKQALDGEDLDLVAITEAYQDEPGMTDLIVRVWGAADGMPFPRSAKGAVDAVLAAYRARQAANVGAAISEQSDDETLASAAEALTDLQALGKQSDFIGLRNALKPAFDRLNTIFLSDGALLGVPSGYDDLDDITAGFQPGQLWIVAGRPGAGKTSFAMNCAEYAAVLAGKRVAVFSLEMSREELVLRMLCGRAGCDWQKLRTGQIDAADWRALAAAGGVLGEADLSIYDSTAVDLPALVSAVRREHAARPIDLVVLDYLQLMSSGRGRKNRQEEIATISRGLKTAARECRLPILALSQLNRQLESRQDKRPMLADLRESGAIEQDADGVIFVHRPEMYDESAERGLAEIIVAKNRSGPIGMVDLAFRKELTRFEQLARREHRALGDDNLPPGDRI